MRSSALLAPWLLVLGASCGGGTHDMMDGGDVVTTDGDGGGDAAHDGGGCTEVVPIHSVYPGPLYVQAGGTATAALRLLRDRGYCGADYAITFDDGSLASAPSSVHIDLQHGYVEFTVTGLAAGHTRIHVTQTNPPLNSSVAMMQGEASADLTVLAPTVPSCPSGTSTSGTLTAGANVAGASGTALAAASVTIPATATDVMNTPVTISCASDQLPAGYDAIGPAVSFAGPYATLRFPREIPITVPVNPALVPSMYELQTEIAYTGPYVHTPRIVAFANTRFTLDGTAVQFLSPRMGTFQAVVRHGLGSQHTTRHMTWRGVMGISMGGLGSSMIGTRNASKFDFIAPLGGAADWAFFGWYFRTYHMGGFCTAADRAAGMDCSMGSNARTPPAEDYFEVQQNFEWFNYPDGYQGQGGTFDRHAYMTIFRDIDHMFSNALVPTDPANGVLPLGVPASQLTMTDADRCAAPVTLTGFCDDEFNPDGSLPVITFCDGINVSGHAGEFQPGQGDYPFEMGLAVDINRNGIRDPGEPIIRDLGEPFDDVGSDQLPDTQEPGYDAMNNPDPNGDDYDRQFNPLGAEGNHLYDMGEHYDDVGLDGVPNTAGTCMYDVGEGNGHWDGAAGINDFLSHNPTTLYEALPQSEAHRLGVWGDGGTRDLFNFGAVANHFAGAVSAQGESLHIYDNFASLVTGVQVNPNTDAPDPGMGYRYTFTDVDYAHLARHSMLRYGFVDATMDQIVAGDGGHVGTIDQAVNRFNTAFEWAQAQWPGGDRAIVANHVQEDDAGRCANGNLCSFDFTSPNAHRTGPVSIYLPPGYHDAANASETYPVVFVLHGYGQQPSDLLATGLLVSNYMTSANLADWQRPQKFIMVFPDGRCRADQNDGCPRGTFYVDSPNPGNAQMETFFMDLYDYVAANYRARPASDVDVVE